MQKPAFQVCHQWQVFSHTPSHILRISSHLNLSSGVTLFWTQQSVFRLVSFIYFKFSGQNEVRAKVQ